MKKSKKIFLVILFLIPVVICLTLIYQISSKDQSLSVLKRANNEFEKILSEMGISDSATTVFTLSDYLTLKKENSNYKEKNQTLEASVSNLGKTIIEYDSLISDFESELSRLKALPIQESDLEKQIKTLKSTLEEKERIIALQKKKEDEFDSFTANFNEVSSLLDKSNDENLLLKSTLQTLYGENLLKNPQDSVSEGIEASILYKYLFLGEVYLALKEYDLSAQFFEKANMQTLPMGPLSEVFFRRRDLSYKFYISHLWEKNKDLFLIRDFSEAISGFQRALDYSDSVDNVYHDDLEYYLALSYYNTLQYAKAIECFQKVYGKTDSDYRIHSIYYLVNIYLLQKEKSKAKQLAAELLDSPYYKNFATQILSILK